MTSTNKTQHSTGPLIVDGEPGGKAQINADLIRLKLEKYNDDTDLIEQSKRSGAADALVGLAHHLESQSVDLQQPGFEEALSLTIDYLNRSL